MMTTAQSSFSPGGLLLVNRSTSIHSQKRLVAIATTMKTMNSPPPMANPAPPPFDCWAMSWFAMWIIETLYPGPRRGRKLHSVRPKWNTSPHGKDPPQSDGLWGGGLQKGSVVEQG